MEKARKKEEAGAKQVEKNEKRSKNRKEAMIETWKKKFFFFLYAEKMGVATRFLVRYDP